MVLVLVFQDTHIDHMQVFRSKIDLWLIMVIAASIFLPFTLAWKQPAILMIVSFTALPVFLLTAWLFWATRYVIIDNVLIIHTGLGKINIPLEGIESVKPSRSLLSSPALSIDRLEIRYAKNKTVLISPKDKLRFLAAIGMN